MSWPALLRFYRPAAAPGCGYSGWIVQSLHRSHTMGMFSFIKEAGEKLFGHKEVEAAAAAAAPTLDELNTTAAHAIRDYIETQNLGVTGLFVLFDGASGKVTVQGEAPTQEASEKVTLCCGNVTGVQDVENLLSIAEPADESQYHDVVRGDTLSAIAKAFYGNANKYMAIFEANNPMLSNPDRIYPGQKLRIPPLA
jgi:nucleoid-associated protein YgaU